MGPFRRSGEPRSVRVTLGLLVLATVTLLTIDARDSGVVDGMKKAALGVLSPVESATSGLTDPIVNVWNGAFDFGDLEEENERLRAELAALESQGAREANAQAQLDELRQLQDLDDTMDLPRVTVRRVGGAASNFDQSIQIDKGTNDGIQRGMPVVTAAGLVGRVSEVSDDRAVVQPVSDPELSIGVRLVQSGDIVVARGGGEGRPLRVDAGIGRETEVAVGEIAVTSGLDESRYPPDLPVGQVVSALASNQSVQPDVRIEPLADLERFLFAEVILWGPAS